MWLAGRELREGIFAGYSSGANVAAALKVAGEAKPGEVIVTLCDASTPAAKGAVVSGAFKSTALELSCSFTEPVKETTVFWY